MELRIVKGSLMINSQTEFNLHYPYLKIEFFKKTLYSPGKNVPNTEKINLPNAASKQERFDLSATINIKRTRTVAELKEGFCSVSGISIKLFRKSRSAWIETLLTENWSLGKQNEEGEFISQPIIFQE